MPDLRDHLHGAVDLDDATLDASFDMADVRARAGRVTARRRAIVAGSVAAVLLLVAGVVAVAVSGRDDADPKRRKVVTDDGTERDPRGHWQELPDGPLSERRNPVMAWTGTELLVIGGYDASRCGDGADCGFRLPRFRDAAAYDPATRQWREIAGPPDGIDLGSDVVVVGGQVYVSADEPQANDDVEPVMARYDPVADQWSSIPYEERTPYGPDDGAERVPRRLAAWGDRVVAYVGSQERAAAREANDLVYDPETAGWTDLPATALDPQFDRRMLEVDGTLVVIGIPIDGPTVWVPARLVEVDPTTTTTIATPEPGGVSGGPAVVGADGPVYRWERLIGSSPTVADRGASADGLESWVAHGTDLINMGPKPAAGVLDLAERPDGPNWVWLPDPGDVSADGDWPTVAVAGDEVAVDRGRAMELDRLRWFAIGRPAGAPAGGADLAMAWAADRLVLWGKDRAWEWTPPSFDPPRAGHIEITATGAVEGSVESSDITCDRDGPGMRKDEWSGTIGDTRVDLLVGRQIEGDLDGVTLFVRDDEGSEDEPRYGYLEHHVRNVADDGTVSVDVELTNMVQTAGVTPDSVHLTAEWRCPD